MTTKEVIAWVVLAIALLLIIALDLIPLRGDINIDEMR